MRLEQLEAPIAQLFDVGHGQIRLEQHAIATCDRSSCLPIFFGDGRVLLRHSSFGFGDLAFLETDGYALVVEDVAITVGVFGRNLVAVMDDAVGVGPLIKALLTLGVTRRRQRDGRDDEQDGAERLASYVTSIPLRAPRYTKKRGAGRRRKAISAKQLSFGVPLGLPRDAVTVAVRPDGRQVLLELLVLFEMVDEIRQGHDAADRNL